MSRPVLTRRSLMASAGAALGAVGVPVAASALAGPVGPDADLFRLLDRWNDARAAWDATEAPYEAAAARAKAAYPPMPDALEWRGSDFPRTSYGRAASDAIGDTGRRQYGPRGVEWLRKLHSSVQWDEAAETRRREIVEAHDAWMRARKSVDDATGYTAAVAASEAVAEAWSAAEDALTACQPRTVVGLAHKAAWVADLLSREAAADDLGEVFARQVARFGGVVS